MRFNRTTFICLALMAAGGLFLTQADMFLGNYQLYILKLFFINAILALSLISILPQLIVFFCAQDQFVEGISAGAVKG